MMAGHHVVPKPRERNGRIKREPAEIRDLRAEAKMRSVVLAQPHRNGSLDQRRRWPIGRMILDGRVRVRDRHGNDRIDPAALERAAERYAKSHANEQWLMDSRRPYSCSGPGSRRAPTQHDRDGIEKEAGDIRRALRDAGPPRVAKAMQAAIIDASPDFDERCFGFWVFGGCSAGLAALVDLFGLET